MPNSQPLASISAFRHDCVWIPCVRTTLTTARVLLLLCLCFCPFLDGQTATFTGHVTDESGAVVPGAAVVLRGPDGLQRTTTSGADGVYSFAVPASGEFTLQASAPGLAMAQPEKISLAAAARTLDLRLRIVVSTAQITVEESAVAVSTDSSANASATVITGSDLQSLADNPEDLQADLEALAGPSAGPSGGAIFVDGFSSGQLPPKESIREVRLNQNPFSPEYDKFGMGRIEIFTKPGTDKYHASIGYNLGTDRWNSRNPYAAQKAPFLLQETENSFSGPLSKRSSFTFDLERQAVDNGSVTNAVIVDPVTLQRAPFSSVLRTPQRHLRVGPHVDYQLNEKNYLSLRYTLTRAHIDDAGIGGFDLISRGFHLLNTFNTAQVIETSVHGASLNETRFQYFRWGSSSAANRAGPEIQVLGAFNGGGANNAYSHDVQSSYELQNNTSITHGPHAFRFGTRLRGQIDDSYLPQNFNGTFTFGGALAPPLDASNHALPGALIQIDSIEQYRRTLIGAAGGGASQFTIAAGQPAVAVHQFDWGVFLNDDWRVKPNLTVNLGIRYEKQTNIRDAKDFAPRLGFAWSPGAKGNKPSRTVLRGGFGLFYDRFGLGNTLIAQRYNGIVQQQYVITNPSFFTATPSIAVLGATSATQSVRQVDPYFRAPYLFQSALTAERQLPRNTTLALTYSNVHALHVLRSLDINAPLPGTYAGPGTGVYPYAGRGPIFLMTASGLYNQNQLLVNVNSKLNPAVSIFTSYVLNRALSNSDGLGTHPGNPYDYSGEYGPASSDVRHRFVLGGSINTRWNVRLNPLVSFQSGAPFNITAGDDPYGTTLFTARPGLATDFSRPGLVQTAYGLLDPNPIPGETLLGRNAGRGPALVSVNLRIGKVWSFGPERGTSSTPSRREVFSVPASRRYTVTASLAARNVLNHTNAGPIIGNISSPLFGRANQVAGNPNGEGFSENANNRRLELQVRFAF